MIHVRNFVYAFIACAIFYAAQVVATDDAGGWDGKDDLEKCRPHGNEVSMVRVNGGRIECDKHEKLAYGMAAKLPIELQMPVKQ